MKQISLNLKNYVSNANVINNYGLQKSILHTIFLSFGVIFVSYVLVIMGIIFNIAERKALDTQARNLLNEVGELELTYLSKSSNIDISLSKSLGYREVKAGYATRKSLGYISPSENNIKLAKNEI